MGRTEEAELRAYLAADLVEDEDGAPLPDPVQELINGRPAMGIEVIRLAHLGHSALVDADPDAPLWGDMTEAHRARALLFAATILADLQPDRVTLINKVAGAIRQADGNHQLGAGALAEAIVDTVLLRP